LRFTVPFVVRDEGRRNGKASVSSGQVFRARYVADASVTSSRPIGIPKYVRVLTVPTAVAVVVGPDPLTRVP
jgi:hypothetical protein